MIQETFFDAEPETVRRDAVVSPCGLYRYTLTRRWDDGPCVVNFIMLNPSIADSTIDDPTIRRCIAFARSWNYAALVVTNLYALRATDPKALWKAPDPIGPENDAYLEAEARNAATVVCAWGNHGAPVWSGKKWVRGRGPVVLEKLKAWGVVPYALRRTAALQPSHLLHLPADLWPVPIDESPRPEVAWVAAGFDPKGVQ